MRARIFGVFLIAWVAVAAASALRAQPAPGPGVESEVPTATRCAKL